MQTWRKAAGLAEFGRAEGGGVAIIFALAALPVFGIVAAAIDYARAANLRQSMQHAADAATFAARAKAFGSESEMRAVVRANLDANLPAHLKGAPFEMKVPADRSRITIEMDTTVPTTLLGIVGVQKLDVAISASARLTPRMPAGAVAAMPGLAGGAGGGAPADARALEAAMRNLGGGGLSGLGGAGIAAPTAMQSNEDMLRAAEQAKAELSRMFGAAGLPAGGGGLSPADLDRLQGAFRR